jgi:sugar phosphate isomerase/epimerase
MEKRIDLGGSAKSPQDVQDLHALGLAFAEVAITDPLGFSGLLGEYRSLKDSLGLYYLCHGPREGDPNDVRALESEFFPKILRILPLMNELEMKLLTLHLWLDRRFIKEDVLSFKVDLLKRIVREASKARIVVCIENLSEEAPDMAKALEEIPALMVTLDLGHAELLCEENRSIGFIEQVPGRIQHLHLHDNRGGNSPKDDLHLPPGEGQIDFKRMFTALARIHYDRTVTLELKPHEIKKCLAYVSELVSCLGHGRSACSMKSSTADFIKDSSES